MIAEMRLRISCSFIGSIRDPGVGTIADGRKVGELTAGVEVTGRRKGKSG